MSRWSYLLVYLGLTVATAVRAGVLSDRLLRGESVPGPVISEENQAISQFNPDQPVVSRGFGLADDAAGQRDYHAGLGAVFNQNYRLAVEIWTALAAAGHAEAQVSLGWLYQRGAGVPQDYTRAKALYDQAAAQGHAIAQNNLGVLYEKGWGVAQDVQTAANWYRRAAESGYRFAQYNLGMLCIKKDTGSCGDGVDWLRRAAEQGVDAAKVQLNALGR